RDTALILGRKRLLLGKLLLGQGQQGSLFLGLAGLGFRLLAQFRFRSLGGGKQGQRFLGLLTRRFQFQRGGVKLGIGIRQTFAQGLGGSSICQPRGLGFVQLLLRFSITAP